MIKSKTSRRSFLKKAFWNLSAIVPMFISPRKTAFLLDHSNLVQAAARPLKVVCVGAHPDDAESGCGGTLARYADLGHKVTIVYLTRGERGIPGKSLDEAALIRSAEAEAACRIIGAKPLFAGQIDGATEINKSRIQNMTELILAEEPNIVFTHWPIDTHLDHQTASTLTIRASLNARRPFQLYFFEVETGIQTIGFTPTDYVNITTTREKKKAALFAHKSQNGQQIYQDHHKIMDDFRGREAGVPAAEAFIRFAQNNHKEKLLGLAQPNSNLFVPQETLKPNRVRLILPT